MGYAIDGHHFKQARQVLADAAYPTDILFGVYPYESGEIHCITSEDDSTPRIVLKPHRNGSFSVDPNATREYNVRRVEAKKAEEARAKAAAEALDARTMKAVWNPKVGLSLNHDTFRISHTHDPMPFVLYLTGFGVRVELENIDTGETTIFEPVKENAL